MTFLTITPPAIEPVTAGDIVTQLHLRLDVDEVGEQDLIEQYAASARARAEAITRSRFITQTVQLRLDGFGCGIGEAIPLQIAPIQSVAAVRYIDGGGVQRVLPPSEYRLIKSRQPYELWPRYGQTWPVSRADADVVEIDMVVGYGNTGASVPADIRQALRLMIAAMFDNRENIVHGSAPVELPEGARQLLSAHTLWV